MHCVEFTMCVGGAGGNDSLKRCVCSVLIHGIWGYQQLKVMNEFIDYEIQGIRNGGYNSSWLVPVKFCWMELWIVT